MSDRLALAAAIEEAGIERAKAERVASVIFDAIHSNVATKADISAVRHDIGDSRGQTHAELVQIKTELTARIDLVEHRLFTRLGSLAVVLSGLIVAAMHWWPPHVP